MTSISNLPNEILLQIIQHLPFESVLSSLLVSRRLYTIIKSNWEKIGKTVEMKEMIVRTRFLGNTEFWLNTVYSGNIELAVYPLRVDFIHDASAEDTALVRTITRYVDRKGASFRATYAVPGRRVTRKVQFKHDRPLGELRELLMILLPLIDIRKLVGENFCQLSRNYMDCLVHAVQATNGTRSRGVPVEIRSRFHGYSGICRALRSPEIVFTDMGDQGIMSLDTNLECHIIVLSRITEWYSEKRSIFHLSSRSSIESGNFAMTINQLRNFLAEYERISIIRESETDILIELKHWRAAKILEIFYSAQASETNPKLMKTEFIAREI